MARPSSSSSKPSGPWNEYRELADSISETVADAIRAHTGSTATISKCVSFIPEEHLLGRALPLRATVVHLHRPLRDVLIFISSFKDDVTRPLIEVSIDALLTTLGISRSSDSNEGTNEFSVDAAITYETIEDAIDHTDALFLEGSFTIDLPLGDLQMIVGTGVLESAACFKDCIDDPFAVEAPIKSTVSSPELDDTIPAVSTPGIESFDARLAAQEHADLDTAIANAAAIQADQRDEQNPSNRWAELLSGVEVEVTAELGRTNLTLGAISSLASQSVLTLDQLTHDPLAVFVNGTHYATARLVIVDGEYGIEILEIVDQSACIPPLAA